ncbi:carbohydrate ABC transporter permease [Paenibacillus thalictri]|uniref:Carbohydrate ABC transporter permease n=1 Tax=Paenibacillus thalictri TaxID=2527873 RepID=A0A4Q9DZE3_9BACL|nr:carbohydrate ABC transporter permease [Paenibacillus thalictri]TBL81510.1 carbohydrate ABC transporter permease [Paenibacillus thalictri]
MEKLSKSFLFIFMIFVTLISIFPFYIVFVMSTYYNEDLFLGLPIIPSDYLFENIKTIFGQNGQNFFRIYGNSLLASSSSIILACTVSTFAGYAVAKYDFALKKFVHYFIIITMMLPGQIAIIGYIIEMKNMGLTNTLFPLILHYFAYPFGAFFMTQFIKDSVPTEIIECARLDGCSEFRIFGSIVVPFIKPALATLAILVFLSSWNSYMLPLISINKTSWYTIPLYVTTIGTENRYDFAARMCALALAIFPVLFVFIAGSKSFIKGITAGAVKG